MKLTSLFQIFLSLPDQKIAKFIGGKEEISENDIAITKPYKGPGRKKTRWFIWQYIGPKNDRTLEFQPCDNIETDLIPAQLPGLSTETCTVNYYSIWDLLQIAVLGLIIVKELLYFVTRLSFT
jgi:hypothetical protein